MTDQPLVSIITPTYNRAHYIGETIQSVLAQTYTHFEMLIVDNGSTDNTREVVERFQDPRLRYFYQENSGSPVSPRNKGFQESRGKIICFLDSDDSWLPEKLSTQVSQFRANPILGLVYSDCYLIDINGKIGGKLSDFHKPCQGYILSSLLRSNFIPAVTVAIRKEMLDEFGYLNEEYIISHDFDLYLKIANSYPVGYINRPLTKARVHDASMSRNRVLTRQESLKVIRHWCLGNTKSQLTLYEKRNILALHCFLNGLELLNSSDQYEIGRSLLREAVHHNPFHPLYWIGCLLSVAPLSIIRKIMTLARKRWSIESIFNN